MAAVLDGAALEHRLIATAQGQEPAAADGVRLLIALVTGVPTVLVLLTFLGGALLARGRAGGRRLLLVTAPLAVVAAGVAQSVVAGGVDLDRGGLLAQAGLLVLAMLSLFVRPVRASLVPDRH